jgi:hypothetical protein
MVPEIGSCAGYHRLDRVVLCSIPGEVCTSVDQQGLTLTSAATSPRFTGGPLKLRLAAA